MSLFAKEPNFDFIGKRWYAVALSAALITAGVVVMVLNGGLRFGIDFSGGSLMVLEFAQPTSEAAVRDALTLIDEKDVQQYGDSGGGVLVRLPQADPEEGTRLEEGAERVLSLLNESSLGEFEEVSRELVGPVIGAELQQRGVSAFLFAMVGILGYIAFRFSYSFGVGAIVAVAHDILVTFSLLTLFGYELSLNVVAAMLTITGYSVNDSIVVFDRVRENTRRRGRGDFPALVNTSVNQTLARTIITSGTTAFTVLALFVFGGEVLRGFAFTMFVGVVTGTYSTIFIAAPVAILITQWRVARRGLPASDATSPRRPQVTATPSSDAPTRPTRPQAKRRGRNVRV